MLLYTVNWSEFENVIYSFFSVLKISPGCQNQVLLWIKIECCLGLCVDALNFDPGQHSILTPSSTWFWPQELIFKTEKDKNHNFKRDSYIFLKAIHLIIFLRFYGKKLFLNLGIPLMKAFGLYISGQVTKNWNHFKNQKIHAVWWEKQLCTNL